MNNINISFLVSILLLFSNFSFAQSQAIEVRFSDNIPQPSNSSQPKLSIKNNGTEAISDFKCFYYFSVDEGKIPILEDWDTPKSDVTLERVNSTTYRIKYDFSSTTILPGEVVPYSSGNVVGIHYQDWSPLPVNKYLDSPAPPQQTPTEVIPVYDANDMLIAGQPANVPSNNIVAQGEWVYSGGKNRYANPQYTFDLNSNSDMEISIDADTDDGYIYLIDNNGNVVGESDVVHGELSETLNSGSYTIVATTSDFAITDDFEITVTCSDNALENFELNERKPFDGNYHDLNNDILSYAYFGDGEEIATSTTSDRFLELARDNGYKYVVMEFRLSRGNTASLESKKDDFLNAFTKTNDYGLRLIPKIQIGSSWSGHWKHARDNSGWGYTDIGMVEITGKNNGGDLHRKGMPSLAFESSELGIDKAFMDVLSIFREAHIESGVQYPLQFIHLGFDEPGYYNRTMIGSCKAGASTIPGTTWEVISLDKESAADIGFMSTYTDKAQGVRDLITTSLYRKLEQVRACFNEPNAQVLIFGDVWDPEHNNGRTMEYFDGTTEYEFTIGEEIAQLGVLTPDQREIFRDGFIFEPWCYSINSSTADSDDRYTADISYNHFADNDLFFLIINEIISPDQTEISRGRWQQAYNIHSRSSYLPHKCVGYGATPWTADVKEEAFETIEFMSRLKRTNTSQTLHLLPAIF